MLLRAGAEVELCHVTEKGQSAQKGESAKKVANTSKKPKAKDKKKGGAGSDSDSEHIFESEDEAGASPKGWKIGDNRKAKINKDELPTFTIKTRLRSKSISLADEPMDTDDDVDQLDPTPSQINILPLPLRGTKRKSEEDLPLFPALSASSRPVPEVIMVPSPKKKRLTQSSTSYA